MGSDICPLLICIVYTTPQQYNPPCIIFYAAATYLLPVYPRHSLIAYTRITSLESITCTISDCPLLKGFNCINYAYLHASERSCDTLVLRFGFLSLLLETFRRRCPFYMVRQEMPTLSFLREPYFIKFWCNHQAEYRCTLCLLLFYDIYPTKTYQLPVP